MGCYDSCYRWIPWNVYILHRSSNIPEEPEFQPKYKVENNDVSTNNENTEKKQE